MEVFNLFMIVILIILTAFFVAAEFAIVKIRKTKIDALAAEGNANAIAVQKVISNLDGYLSACQLGITITALGLGWLGEPTIEDLLHPLFVGMGLSEPVTTTLSFAIAFALITFLHVVFGELAPKSFAIQKAEAISLLLAKPLILFSKVMFPFIWTLNGAARVLVRMFGLPPANEHEAAHSEEELRMILSESYKKGEINKAEMEFVNNVFEFDERMAKEIMIPRTEMMCLFLEDSFEENLSIMKKEKYTRYPVAFDDKDKILGVVNVKEIFNDYISDKNKPLNEYVRPVAHVSETAPIKELLKKMQKSRSHMAIVMDEYGGTAGLLTVEDIVEELVGEIQDEFDIDEKPMIQKVDKNKTIVDGKVLIAEVNEKLGTTIDNTEIDTIGGWILSEKMEAEKGTTIEKDGYQFTVTENDGHQIKELEIKKV
ncbi:hemolysin family protein [Alkalihalobacillus sp. AL-G]|uniref:hemolysin family protein n=1 Tax=Alkalihalobacillus sp. AL-G TaxID=2926399 RepID=UPI00272A5034|nr:hemolysin family protein [Alkalihalobacillus sp. AL-G]WLD92168.1 hemolysin family protein [Alkalihalobacillus sp. AL-G]